MKKLIYFLLVVVTGAAVTSCEPLDDIYADLEANDDDFIVGNAEFTLTEDDYDELGLNFPNFSTVDDARSLIPELLTSRYPVWGKGSIALVTYDLYAPLPTDRTRNLIVYTVTTEDYDMYPDTERFNNFDRESQIFRFLNDKYPNPENRTLVSLTYKFFDGSVNTLNNGFLYINGDWMFIQGLTDAEYREMGEGFPNFSNEDEAETKLPILLNDKFKFQNPQEGETRAIMYKLFVTDEFDVDNDGRTDDRTTYSFIKWFIYNGSSWEVYDNTVEQTLQFGHDGNTWVPDNTVQYTLAASDYTYIATELSDKYPQATASMARFSNLDRREGNAAYWSDEMIIEALNILLNNVVAPNAEEGQKYVVTFDIYNGSNTIESFSLIKEGGVWVIND